MSMSMVLQKTSSIGIVLGCLVLSFMGFAQDKKATKVSQLFDADSSLSIRLSYPRTTIKKVTNDSVYVASELSYLKSDSQWATLPVRIQSRGAFRKRKCYFTPLKFKIKDRDCTLFEKHKKLKLVLPCLRQGSKNDYILKEYLVYQMYEILSEYHFKTRLLDVEYTDTQREKSKTHELKGVFIEDVKKMAKRNDGRLCKRKTPPKGYDDLAAVRAAIFQFMIGNTDFSVSHNHNIKLIFIDGIFVPIPYDFDMSGFVNTSYSLVSQVRKEQLPIEDVTERYYMGYKRSFELFEKIRLEFLDHETELLQLITHHRDDFEKATHYEDAKAYIVSFFRILKDKKKFRTKLYDVAIEF